MKERPILFSAPMVRAILDGSKTQTRRVMRPQMVYGNVCGIFPSWYLPTGPDSGTLWPNGKEKILSMCPFGHPGDRLWIRETFIHEPADYCWEASVSIPCRPAHTVYRADSDPTGKANGAGWTPSIHMPRALSRITLEVTGVRVERLNDCSQADAVAEGAPPSHPSIDAVSRQFGYEDFSRSWYAQLWEQINGPGSWDANPFVWVIEFRRV